MIPENYHAENDKLFQNYIRSKPRLTDASISTYAGTLNKFCTALNSTLTDIVTACLNQQNRIIEKQISHGTDEDGNIITEKQVITFDVNSPESIIKQIIEQYILYSKSENNKNITINGDIDIIKSFLLYNNVILPKLQRLPDDRSEWYLLTNDDFKFVINDSSLVHASLIKFLMSSGMRIKDALSLTIGDFMEATSEYHNIVDVNDFIDNAPSDMIGSYYFHPHKTQRFRIECQTFNDPETSNLILQNLRKIKNEYIPYAKKKYDLDLVMSKDDALFGSQKANFKGHIPTKAIASRFWLKNKKLREHRIQEIKQAIHNGKLSIEDYDKEVSKIPKFHAHGCRKYFESMIARNCGDLRICTLLEGHVSPVATDSSYIKKEYNEVKEAYLSAIPDLSLEHTETRTYTSEVRREMENKINELVKENEELKQQNEREVKALWDEVNDIKRRNEIWENLKKE